MSETRCFKHSFEVAEASCRNCGYDFCNECLVYAFGPNKPPYCVSCALAAAGVRSNAGRRPAMSKKEMRRRERERRKAERKAQKAPEPAAVGPAIDWSVPDDASGAFDWADDPNTPSSEVASF